MICSVEYNEQRVTCIYLYRPNDSVIFPDHLLFICTLDMYVVNMYG